jgi:hypothetical protein
LKSKQGKKTSKNKIYFICDFEKVPYLCNPNGNEGKTKNQVTDVTAINRKD